MCLTSQNLHFFQNCGPSHLDCVSRSKHQFLSPQAHENSKSSAQILFHFATELLWPCVLRLFAQDMNMQAPQGKISVKCQVLFSERPFSSRLQTLTLVHFKNSLLRLCACVCVCMRVRVQVHMGGHAVSRFSLFLTVGLLYPKLVLQSHKLTHCAKN